MNIPTLLLFVAMFIFHGCHSDVYITDIYADSDSVNLDEPGEEPMGQRDTDPNGGDTRSAAAASVKPDWPSQPTWQWQMQDGLATDVDADVYILDLFATTASDLDTLHETHAMVICSFSAGVRESWTDDADKFPATVIGNAVGGQGNDAWVDISSDVVRSIMTDRMMLAVSKGCDGVQPDHMDSYTNDTGWGTTAADQIEYNRFLSQSAHDIGLYIGLTNDLEQAAILEPDFDWVLNESCLEWDECSLLDPFLASNKTVFHVEYADSEADGPAKQTAVCGQPEIADFSTIIKTTPLDAYVLFCE